MNYYDLIALIVGVYARGEMDDATFEWLVKEVGDVARCVGIEPRPLPEGITKEPKDEENNIHL